MKILAKTIIEEIIEEVKLNIIRSIVNQQHDYDTRFDNAILHTDTICKIVLETQVSEVFAQDKINLIAKEIENALSNRLK